MIINEIYNKCEDLSSEKYYYDSSDRKYKLCSNKISNCLKCYLNDNNLIYKQCDDNFSFKHDDNIICDLTLLLENNSNYFTNDSGINYYSCLFYNEVKNCLECNNKEKCSKCISNNYELVNNHTLCLSDTDKESNLYYYDQKLDYYIPCSNLISDCNKCYNTSTCFDCKEAFVLIENDTCLSKEIIEKDNYYFRDETTNKYISCSSIMTNCIKCNSSYVCLLCQDGYNINNNKKCEIINIEKVKDNKLPT